MFIGGMSVTQAHSLEALTCECRNRRDKLHPCLQHACEPLFVSRLKGWCAPGQSRDPCLEPQLKKCWDDPASPSTSDTGSTQEQPRASTVASGSESFCESVSAGLVKLEEIPVMTGR